MKNWYDDYPTDADGNHILWDGNAGGPQDSASRAQRAAEQSPETGRAARANFDFRYEMEDASHYAGSAAERMQARWLWFLSLFAGR
ncbi:MAG: hypothetical protein B6D41_12260 [Chloroflexi bacterium UTCFX4]|jgi:predicted alpha/beta-hydrolase family hydrolase|nr:MAG: hypothetical protein B6D41_12260 [Chloroflexi bacterium UTCFX4]